MTSAPPAATITHSFFTIASTHPSLLRIQVAQTYDKSHSHAN